MKSTLFARRGKATWRSHGSQAGDMRHVEGQRGTAGLWIRGNLRLETCRAHPEVLRFYEVAEQRQSRALAEPHEVPAVPMEAAAMRALPGRQPSVSQHLRGFAAI